MSPLDGHIAYTPGCREALCGRGRWSCTSHVTHNGTELHVGTNPRGIVAVQKIENASEWIDTQKMWQEGHSLPPHEVGSAGSPPWPFVVDLMEQDPRFTTPVTDEEVEEAAQAALRLYQEMSK